MYFLFIISRLAKSIAATTNEHEFIVKLTLFGAIVTKIPIIPINAIQQVKEEELKNQISDNN